MRKKLDTITKDELGSHIDKPLVQVAQLFNRSVAQLKIDLRMMGIPRWPCTWIYSSEMAFLTYFCIVRRVRAIQAKISQLQTTLEKTPSAEKQYVQQQIAKYEKQLEQIRLDPSKGFQLQCDYTETVFLQERAPKSAPTATLEQEKPPTRAEQSILSPSKKLAVSFLLN